VGEVEEHIGARPVAALQGVFDGGREVPRLLGIDEQVGTDARGDRAAGQFAFGVRHEGNTHCGPQAVQQLQGADLLALIAQRGDQQIRLEARHLFGIAVEARERPHLRPQG
jgi:hypothetical protein